jgi:hypothetical protein
MTMIHSVSGSRCSATIGRQYQAAVGQEETFGKAADIVNNCD